MSDKGVNKAKRTVESWGSRWLARLESTSTFSEDALNRGRAYALHDWQLEIDLEPGRAEALARSGPRIRNRATVEAPLLSDGEWQVVIELIANSSARTAALLDHELDLAILAEAKSQGVNLLPPPRLLTTNCSCRNWGELCKHSSAVVFLLADVFDEAPLDLLLWRGLPYEELVERVRQCRRSTGESGRGFAGQDSPGSDGAEQDGNASSPDPEQGQAKNRAQPVEVVAAFDVWNRQQHSLPEALPQPDSPAVIPPYPSDAPANAPFTGAGLHSLVVDAVLRAHEFGQGSSGPMLDLTVEADLGRRAALLEGSGDWSRLVLHAGRSSRELTSRANAWRIAGAAGVEITQTSRETLEINKFVQFRRNDEAQWFRFEKVSGRWELSAGPADDPSLLEPT